MSLTAENARIARKVLRLRGGARIFLLNGRGEIATCELARAGTEPATVTVLDRRKVSPPLPAITLLQGLPKGDKGAFIVQKAIELGVARIVFFEGEHAVARKAGKEKTGRWERVAVEALRQSGNLHLPEISGPLPVADAVRSTGPGPRVFFDETETKRRLRDIVPPVPTSSITVAVGPEGGWSEEDRRILRSAGFESAWLAPFILRTETAAVSALASVHALLG